MVSAASTTFTSVIEPTYTVPELNRAIARVVARAFPEQVWVQGEIRDITRAASGHVYFTLVDADAGEPGSVPESILPVTLFASDKEAVNRMLNRSGAMRMTDGVAVRIRGSLGHFAARGTVQLRMTWIDTEYTLGRLATSRDQLMRALAAEGLVDSNAALPVPLVPLRVGLLTSVGSAAYADFVDELAASGFAWCVEPVDVRVQGQEAEQSILAGLATLSGRPVDVIAIVRGGGAQTDLAVFDGEAIARAVAACRRPVFTGIGHEVDETVLDRVAARSFKTPTACAAGLVSIVTGFVALLADREAKVSRVALRVLGAEERRLDDRAARVTGAARRRISQAIVEVGAVRHRAATTTRAAGRSSRERLSDAGHSVVAVAGRRAGIERTAAADMRRRLAAAAPERIARATARLGDIHGRVEGQSPTRLLARGWSVTTTEAGRLVTDPIDVASGDVLSTRVAGGSIRSIAEPLPRRLPDGRIGS
jgi:exodeoxyribonuclease VII large subunit